jgi:D-glycero-D-manno-heptose 1,7-bisphosphate phosphatase
MLKSRESTEHPLDSQGVWCQILRRSVAGRAALFVDRDDTVIKDTGYLCRVDDLVLIPGAAKVIAAANQRGSPVVMVTNQSGIGRGYYSWTEFKCVQDALFGMLAAHGASIDAVYACAHHTHAEGDLAHPDHPARKPNPGMLLQAASALALDLKSSWLVGDKADDIDAAKRAGLAGALLVATGNAERQRAETLVSPAFEVRFGQSIADAMTLPVLMSRHGR